MLGRIARLLGFQPRGPEDGTDILFASGETVPSDAATGYATGCLFQKSNGGAGTALYVNEGDSASANFDAVSALTAAQEALLSATAGVATASKALVLDASGEVTSGTIIASDLPTVAGVGITGTADNFASRVTKIGTLFKTEIVVDVDGLNCGGTAGDIIGANGAGVAHLGQITAARNGTIFAGSFQCLELPAGGHSDIDLWSAVEPTGVEDTAIGALTSTLLVNSGGLVSGTTLALTAFPAANRYLYLACGTATDATYTAGIVVITLWGK